MVKKIVEEETSQVPPTVGVQPAPVADEVVRVPRKDLERMMDRLDRLEFASSKAQLSLYDARNKTDLGTTACLNVYEGKIIVAWKLLENFVERNPQTGVWTERQTIQLHFLEGEPVEVPYAQFIRRLERKVVKRLSKTQMDNGNEIWKVVTEENGLTEPLTFEIDVRFLN